MNAKQIVYQRPCPRIEIYDPDTGQKAKSQTGENLVFEAGKNTNLLSYSFTLSVNDISGSFSATFYPDYMDKNGEPFSLFDDFKKLQIIKIFEGNNRASEKPVFVGVIKSKKYVAQASDGGGYRRISINGTAITGLVSQFYINLDAAACAMTDNLRTQADLYKKLTINGAKEKNVKKIIKAVWDCFLEISGQLGTPKIAEYLNTFIGDTEKIFDVDSKAEFFYPLGCIFKGQTTQDFFSLIDEIIPSPVYEKFSFVDSDGTMRIKIRHVPFSKEKWRELSVDGVVIRPEILQSFDLTESDDEVYTAFYAYLNGYPVDEQKSLMISTVFEKAGVDKALKDSDKFKIYGYRPLIAHFIGYGVPDGEEDSETTGRMEEMSKNLKEWYENLPDMLKGTLTLPMVFEGETATNRIQPGDVVSFLNGEFYVEGVTHDWNYGQVGTVNLSVSRGGTYREGAFSGKIKDLTNIMSLVFAGAVRQKMP